MIDKYLIARKIIDVLKQIQRDGDFEEMEITMDSCPGQELTEFDSQLWITANVLIAAELEGSIPDDVNIFTSQDGKGFLSVREVAERIAATIENGGGR